MSRFGVIMICICHDFFLYIHFFFSAEFVILLFIYLYFILV